MASKFISLFNIAVIMIFVPIAVTLWVVSPVVRSGSEPSHLLLLLIGVLFLIAAESHSLALGRRVVINILLRAFSVVLLSVLVGLNATSPLVVLPLLGGTAVHAFQIHVFACHGRMLSRTPPDPHCPRT